MRFCKVLSLIPFPFSFPPAIIGAPGFYCLPSKQLRSSDDPGGLFL
jgi:hypothetical protein